MPCSACAECRSWSSGAGTTGDGEPAGLRGLGLGAGIYFSDPACLEHDPRVHMPEHPDTPERLEAIEQTLAEQGWLGWERRVAPPAEDGQLELIHGTRLVQRIKELSLAGCGAIDPDTFVGEPSFRAALHAAGDACETTRALMAGEPMLGSVACVPLATMPNRIARWASACSTTLRSPPSWLSASWAPSAC